MTIESPVKAFTDAEIVFSFLAQIHEKLDDIATGMVESGFVIDMYGDDPGGSTGVIGTQNQGLYRQYNGPFMITDILATWNPSSGSTAILNVAVGATTVATANLNDFPVLVQVSGGTVTQITINGVNTGQTAGTFLLQPGGLIATTNTGAPTYTTTLPAGQTVPPTSVATSVTLQIADRILQFVPANGIESINNLEIEVQHDDPIVFTVTPKQACHLEIMGVVKKRVRETTYQ